MRLTTLTLATGFLALVVAGCAGGDRDDRRAGSLGSEAVAVSWQGDWTAEAQYEAGSMVTHEGSTFVAVTATDQPPEPKCENDCPWTITGVAEGTGAGAQASLGELKVFDYSTGYDGPIESPAAQIAGMNYVELIAELPRITQEINDWLASLAPWVIRHRADDGTVVGERELPAGNYVVFARGVFVSVPGLGRTPTPQGSTPTVASLVSGGISLGSISRGMGKPIGSLVGPLAAAIGLKFSGALKGGSFQDDGLACTLSAGGQVLDTASMSLSGTASATLMGLAVLPATGKTEVSCAHNGLKAGPFVRDLRLVAIKLT